MGLPLGPTFANIFMSKHESVWLNECPSAFKPILYRRYIDDTFLLFRCKSHAPLFLQYLNSQHECINFTMELEHSDQLSFLDCKISRSQNSFSTSVYRKPTFSGLCTSFFSFVPFRFKLCMIKTLLCRGFRISSSFFSMHTEFEFLKQMFKSNGYPVPLVNKQIKNFLDRQFLPQLPDSDTHSDSFHFVFPFFGYQSEKMVKDLKCLLSRYIPDGKFHFILINKYTIGSLFSYKDKLPKGMLAGVVYEYCCPACGMRYVGSTLRNLYVRVSEHAGRSFRTDLPLSNPPQSSIRCHADSCDVSVKQEHFRIIGNAKFNTDLRILESLHIFKSKPRLNDTRSAYPLNFVGH